MVERRPVIEHEQVVYDGIFSLKELYKTLYGWMTDKAYNPIEKRAMESITKTGKHVELELEPYKKFSDYAKSVIRIHVTCHNLTDVEIPKDGHKKKMQKGKVVATFDSWLETDYEHRWETQPAFFVLRSLFEKYVYTPFLSGHITSVRNDTLLVKEHLKAYLNLERF